MMTMISQVKHLVNKSEHSQALKIIISEIDLIKKMRLSEIKALLESIGTIEDYQLLIRLLDEGLMYKHSGFLARYTHRRYQHLQTAIWYCEELIGENKAIEAMEMLNLNLQNKQQEELDEKLVIKAKICEIHCLLELKRLSEVKEKLDVLLSMTNDPPLDKIGYIYWQIGEKARAEKVLISGMAHNEYGAYCYWILSDFYATSGDYNEAYKWIQDGLKQFPQTPGLMLSKIKRHAEMEDWENMRWEMKQLNELTPHHFFQEYFVFLQSLSLYRENKLIELKQLLANKNVKSNPFLNFHGLNHSMKFLTISPVIQESNFCVPASLEMITAYYHSRKTQKEIAEHIFDVTGSKLSTTVNFLENQGYHCKYFFGNNILYRKLIDLSVPVLLSVDMENYSHVQILKGYDNRFSIYHIQDPNISETLYVEYEEFNKKQAHTAFMSIAIVPEEESHLLQFLDNDEDQYFRELHRITDLLETDEGHEGEFLDFMKNNMKYDYTPIYIMNTLFDSENKEFIQECAFKVMEIYQDDEYYILHAVESFIRFDMLELAESYLQTIKRKTYSPYFHFLCGQIYLHQNNYREAIASFKQSLQLDPDQMQLWSFIAISYYYAGNLTEARRFSNIAIQYFSHDRFTRYNHGLILFEQNESGEARTVFDGLIKENKKDSQSWFERARIDEMKGKMKRAERGYLVCAALDSSFADVYIALSNLYVNHGEEQKAISILLQGIEQCSDDPNQLYYHLGNLYQNIDAWDKAENLYLNCFKKTPNEAFPVIGYAQVVKSNGAENDVVEMIRNFHSKFDCDEEFLINGGKLLGEIGKNQQNEDLIREGLSYIESCIPTLDINVEEAIDIYTDLAMDSPYVAEARTYLMQFVTPTNFTNLFHCQAGILYEIDGLYADAIRLYNEAIEIEETYLPFYRLGMTYFEMRQYQLAAEALQHSLQIDPNIAGSISCLAKIAEICDDKLEEKRNMQRLIELSPLSVNMEYFFSQLSDAEVIDSIRQLEARQGNVDELWRLESLAIGYSDLGDEKLAFLMIEKALELSPDNAHIKLCQIKFLIKQQKYKEAKNLLLPLLAKYPDDEELYHTLILLYKSSGKWLKLGDEVEKLAKGLNQPGEVYLLAARVLQSYLDEQVIPDKQPGFQLGKMFGKWKEKTKHILIYGTIVAFYEKAIKFCQDNHAAVIELASFYETAEMIDNAEKILKKAIDHSWGPDLSLHLGQLYLKKAEITADISNYEKSINELKRISSDSRVYVEALLIKGRAFSGLQKMNAAEKCYRKVLYLNASKVEAYFELGRLLNIGGMYEEAIKIMLTGLEIFPEDVAVRLELGVAYNHAGLPMQALELFEHVIHRHPDLLAAHYFKACSLAILDRGSEARNVLKYVFANDEDEYFQEMAENEEALCHLLAKND
ncbi:tetratricopeptide (TPR) repeat protein [Cytobacillus horneckiae]|nr:tetratricopeptide repeat protein [Cytobacillus horneckiae]